MDEQSALKGNAAGWLANAVGTNRYAYAGNDPINKADPNGHVVSDTTQSQSPTAAGSSGKEDVSTSSLDKNASAKSDDTLRGKKKGSVTGPSLAQMIPEEEVTRRGLLEEYLDPTAPLREELYQTYRREIGKLDPRHPALTYLSAPDSAPSWEAVNRNYAELNALRDRIADRIANGHAFGQHAAEFGATSPAALSTVVRGVIADPYAQFRALQRDRSAFYNSNTNTLVIVDPNSSDFGTVFAPTSGQTYVNNLR